MPDYLKDEADYPPWNPAAIVSSIVTDLLEEVECTNVSFALNLLYLGDSPQTPTLVTFWYIYLNMDTPPSPLIRTRSREFGPKLRPSESAMLLAPLSVFSIPLIPV